MEKYSKAVSEMYSQFKKREANPMEKYIGRLALWGPRQLEVVGYNVDTLGDGCLIADATLFGGLFGGWTKLDPDDVIFKRCEAYCYVSIDDLID